MKSQHLIIIAVVAGIVLLLGIGVLGYALSQGGSLPGLTAPPTPTPKFAFVIPDVKVTPPPSLDEIAAEMEADYPELANLLRDPKLGSVYKDFYLAYTKGGPETAIALARQRGILNDNDEIEITLVLNTENAGPLIAELEAEGVIVKGSFANKINIAIPIALIEAQIQAEEPDLILQRISNFEHVIRLEITQRATPKQEGRIRGQGVDVTEAGDWQGRGLTGQGVKVGVLDLGFGGYQDLLGTELPESVTVKAFGDDYMFDQEVHGTACAEIVHEMAPEAELYLAYYDGSDVAMGQAIEWLISQEVDIISNSTGSNGLTPMDGTGFAEELADRAHELGIFFVSAAGNEADTHWRGQFTDSDGNNIHEFFANTEVIPFIPFGPGVQTQIILSWDDWQNVDQDYELILMNEDGTVLGKSEDPQGGGAGDMPVEGFLYEFEDSEIYLLSVENYDGLARGDATFDLFIHGGLMHPDYIVPQHSLSSPADANGAFTVGAVNWADDVLEVYSSQGPTTDGRIKPDLAAPSVVDSRSYAPEAFDGTSAATPHVAGAAALILQAFPDMSPDELAALLQNRALDLGDSGPDNAFGAGRLSLGAAPETGPQTEAPPEVTLQPTSTPRPPEAAVGLPGQTGIGGETGGQAAPADSGDDGGGLVGVLVLLGTCMLCLAGLLFVLVIIGLIVAKRKR